uniref:Uncharacterized protein n=1 Tax=Magallana gigas TaxID=29159 RepID=K1QYY8_MAGGI
MSNTGVISSQQGLRQSLHLRVIVELVLLRSQCISAFQELADGVEDGVLNQLLGYIRDTWIQSTTWPVSSWCVFGQGVRTNNEVEGWHTRMNVQKARGCHNLPFYTLLTLLRQEADLLPLQRRLVSEGTLKRLQRKTSRKGILNIIADISKVTVLEKPRTTMQ